MDICPSLSNAMTSQTSATFFALILIWLLHVLIAAPYYTIQPDGQTWPCAIIFTHQYLLWWSENCKTQADVFQRVVREPNVSCVELLDLSNQQQQQGYAWYRRSRRRCSLGQNISALANRWPDPCCSSPLFHPNVPNSFCALQTPLLMFVGRFLGSLSILCWLGTFCRG